RFEMSGSSPTAPTRLPGMGLAGIQVFDFDPDILVDIKPKPMDPGSTAYREDKGVLHTGKTKEYCKLEDVKGPFLGPQQSLAHCLPTLAYRLPPELFPAAFNNRTSPKCFFGFSDSLSKSAIGADRG
mgnify:CR=1